MRRPLHRLLLDAEPGRFHNSLILVAGVLIILLIWETFRIPEAATACYVVLFISRTERTSTIQTAVALGAAAVVSIFLVIAVNAATLSQPALRIGLMATITAGALFLYRAARLGPLFFGAGFVTVYGLTISDSVNRLGLTPSTVSNVAGRGAGLPFILFGPPEEALVRGLLWLMLVVTVPACVVVILNKAFGIDPATLLHRGLDDRLAAVESWCSGEPGAAHRLEALARQGSAELVSFAGLAEKEHGTAQPKGRNEAVIHAMTRLILACMAAEQLQPGRTPEWAGTIAAGCRTLRIGHAELARHAVDDPVGTEADRALTEIAEAKASKPSPAAGKQEGFWAEDAFSARNVQFSLKVTCAAMFCLVLNNALNWPGIGTDVVTCFFVSLGTLGESGHKMVLRLSGCLLGGTLGIASIILLMPLMTDIGHLFLLVAPVTFAAAWIACGSERISYAGWQLGLAFYLTVLDGFGPTLELEPARDRAVGILIGTIVTYAVLSSLWPVRVEKLAAGKLADALAALVQLLGLPDAPERRSEQDQMRSTFAKAITAANTLLSNEPYEGEQSGILPVDEAMSSRLQSLVIPVSMLAASSTQDPARRAVTDWLRDAEGRLRSDRVAWEGFPQAPALPDGPATRARILLRHAFRELRARPDQFSAANGG